jgi:hypothetical protein
MSSIVKKLGNPRSGFNPKTAATPQNTPKAVKQGAGGPAAQSQLSGPPQPFQNKMNSANFQRLRTNPEATKGYGDGATPRTSNVVGKQPMSDEKLIRGAGYSRKPGLANYTVHDVTQHRFGGAPAPRGNRHPRPLIKAMSNQDFLDGAALYRKEHGNL